MTDKARDRKETPVFSGVVKYFPNALRAIAKCSRAGNEQHNPGTPLHWDKSKSSDHHDALMRHLMESGTIDDDGIPHSAKVAWRALAILQLEEEQRLKVGVNELDEEDFKKVSVPQACNNCYTGIHIRGECPNKTGSQSIH